MTIDDVALVVFAQLVQKDNTLGNNSADREQVAARAFEYAEAFMAVQEAHRGVRNAGKTSVEPLDL